MVNDAAPPVFVDGALNVAENFFLVLLRPIDIGCCFLGTKYLPDRKGKGGDKCNVANNTRGAQRSLSQTAYVLSGKKERGGT